MGWPDDDAATTRDGVLALPLRMEAHVTNSDAAAAVVARDLGYDVSLTADRMAYHHEGVIGDVVSHSEILIDADLTCRTEPVESVMLVQVRAGDYEIDARGHQQAFGAGTSYALPAGEGVRLEVHRATISSTVLPAAAVLAVARESFDVDGDAVALRRDVTAPSGRAAAQSWASTVAFYRGQVLARPELYRDDLLRTEATRTLVTTAIAAFGLVDLRAVQASESAAVRRARAFMDDNLRRPITAQDVAHAARIGPRALQNAFRKQRGESPMAYLRAGRLAGAHAELLAADPSAGTTVGSVAASWGFSNQGRFSAAFRAVFGENPTETLQR